MRHCRLAMLCAAGWPMAELWGQDWFDGYFLADGGRAPSILNGGLISDVQFPPLPTFSCWASSPVRPAGAQDAGHAEVQTRTGMCTRRTSRASAGVALGRRGRRGLRPARIIWLLGNDAVGRFTMRELELNHGRVAMLAVLSYVMLESVTHVPVVQLTPFLFGKWYW